jgi:DNA-binding transcriptional LysR family regulator
LTPRDLQNRRIITWSKDAAIYRLVEDWFTRNGANPGQKITCNTAVTMASLTAAGLGVTLLPRELVKQELAAGMLRSSSPTRRSTWCVTTFLCGLGNELGERTASRRYIDGARTGSAGERVI